jgi:hypothetical protein
MYNYNSANTSNNARFSEYNNNDNISNNTDINEDNINYIDSIYEYYNKN